MLILESAKIHKSCLKLYCGKVIITLPWSSVSAALYDQHSDYIEIIIRDSPCLRLTPGKELESEIQDFLNSVEDYLNALEIIQTITYVNFGADLEE